jgi:phage major head subunit gpT-like protein
MAIKEQWAELLEPGLRTIFEVQMEALAAASPVPALFNVISSDKASEYFMGIGGFGDWKEYEGRIEYDHNDQLYKTTLTHKTYTDAFKVEMELVEDDLYNVINSRPRGMALSAARTREKHAASIFNNAFSSSYTGGDAVALCATNHPLSPTHASDTHGNKGTSALTYDSLVTTRRLMREYVDDRGELIPMNPDTLVVPAELEENAFSIVQTMNKVDVADYHANFIGSRINRVVVWDYLTNAKDWFVLDSQLAKIHLLWIDRSPIDFAMDPTSNFSLEARYRGRGRWSYGFSDWRWIYGHDVT